VSKIKIKLMKIIVSIFFIVSILLVIITGFTFYTMISSEPQADPEAALHVLSLHELDELQKMIAAFEDRHPNISVSVSFLESNEPPDVVLGACRELLAYKEEVNLVEREEFESMDPSIASEAYLLPYGDECFADDTVEIPFMKNIYVYYNKEIFDLFAVSYLDQPVSLAEISDYAQELTGHMHDDQYEGVTINIPELLTAQALFIPTVDFVQNKSIVYGKDEWVEQFDNLLHIYSVPGIEEYRPEEELRKFYHDQTIAMYIGSAEIENRIQIHNNNMNNIPLQWGKVQLADFQQYDYTFAITEHMQHPVAAKHFVQFFDHALHRFERVAVERMTAVFPAVSAGEKDIHTALREVDEVINIEIEAYEGRNEIPPTE
jgi:hypothetical protein